MVQNMKWISIMPFVRLQTDGRLFELDGNRKGPVDRGPVVDLLDPSGLDIIREYTKLEQGNMYLSLMVLCLITDETT
jgi:ubiquitin carboxyl-terminal hydrolase L3